MSKNTIGIYSITNVINNKIYIGQSVEIERRWKRHRRELNKDIHTNEYLQRSWIKYGEDSFIFEIIEICRIDELDGKERYWIKNYKSNNYKYGYNLDDGGSDGKKVNKDIALKRAKCRKYECGEDNRNATLLNLQVYEIKELLYLYNKSVSEVAEQYNVPNSTIRNIINGKTYKNVITTYDDELKIKFISKERNVNRVLTYSEVFQIKNLLYKGDLTQREIAELYNIQNHIISSIKLGERYAEVLHPKDEILKKSIYNKLKPKKCRLKIRQVLEIKQMLVNNNLTQVEIAKLYNVNRGTIVNIKNLTYWKYIGEEFNEIISKLDCKNGENNHMSIINTQDVIAIKMDLALTKLKSKEIAKKYNVSNGLVQDIKHFRAWKHVETEYDEIIKKKNETDSKMLTYNLTETHIVNLKKFIYESGLSLKNISKLYNLPYDLIINIKTLEYWSEIGQEYNQLIIDKYKVIEEDFINKVVKIKKEIANTDKTILTISKEIGVNRHLVTEISKLKAYIDVVSEHNEKIKEKLGITNSRKEKITQEKVLEVKKLLSTSDTTVREISEKDGISYYIIQSIWLGKTWLDVGREYNQGIFNRNNSKYFNIAA